MISENANAVINFLWNNLQVWPCFELLCVTQAVVRFSGCPGAKKEFSRSKVGGKRRGCHLAIKPLLLPSTVGCTRRATPPPSLFTSRGNCSIIGRGGKVGSLPGTQQSDQLHLLTNNQSQPTLGCVVWVGGGNNRKCFGIGIGQSH